MKVAPEISAAIGRELMNDLTRLAGQAGRNETLVAAGFVGAGISRLEASGDAHTARAVLHFVATELGDAEIALVVQSLGRAMNALVRAAQSLESEEEHKGLPRLEAGSTSAAGAGSPGDGPKTPGGGT